MNPRIFPFVARLCAGFFALCAAFALATPPFAIAQAQDDTPWVVYEGSGGPGAGKHIALVTGDEEYRSEEALTQLARILAFRHGFKTTVLYAIDPETGAIDPEYLHNISGLHLLEEADLMVMFTRFRDLPEEQMRHIEAFTNSGKPIIGLRTATHAFRFEDPDHPFIRYDTWSEVPGWEGGWGRQVLGETWINHHGRHAVEGTRGLVNYAYEDDPILNGIGDNVYGDTDVYGLTDLPEGTEVLLYGLTLKGLDPYAPPEYETSIVPVAWRRLWTGETGNATRVFATTLGASVDLESEGVRRLLANAVFWGLGMEDSIPEEADVRYVGRYDPTFYGFGSHAVGVYPADLDMTAEEASEWIE